MEPSYDQNGLVAVIAQDHATGEVLMFAYANAEAVRLTQQTGELHLWSRSRQELWHKGATSGNTLKVRDLRIDCDGDALLAIVEPAGPACHTGERTCFYRRLEDGAAPQLTPHEALPALAAPSPSARRIPPRGRGRPSSSPIPPSRGRRSRRRPRRCVRAAREETDDRVDNEAADLLYHLLAVLSGRERTYTDAFEVLLARRR